MLYSIRGLHRRFGRAGAQTTALRDVTLDIAEGELVALVGPSGCGKTTLLQILGGIDPDFEGEIRFLHQSLGQMKASERAALRLAQMGFVFQTSQLLDALTVQQNIALPLWRLRGDRRAAERRAGELAEELGIAHRLGHLPRQLSVGEMQRTAAARALVCEPRVILADEPTASLDAENGEHIICFLERVVRAGRTVVVASHDPAVIRRASRQLRMERGQIAEDSATAASNR
ncbi:MAG TPA: ABC transporter ATP-binding protein [Pseudomonadota bacterium]|nr:ABC transporter ATP-binding protein [Pseudomonadota bacterium]